MGISELLESRSEHSNYFQLAHAVKLSSCWCDALCETSGSGCWLYKNPACPQERSRLEHLVPEGTDMHVYQMSSTPRLTQCQHSLVIVPHDHIIRHEGKVLKRHGQLVFAGEFPLAFYMAPDHLTLSAEESKPVKLMLRALPLIQTHVHNILALSAVLG